MTIINLGDKPDDSKFELKENETYTGVITEQRTWRERLFSWPWKPWKRYNVTFGTWVIEKRDGESE